MSGKSLFFAGSDDDDDNAKMGPEISDDDVSMPASLPAGSQISESESGVPSENEGLFFASSDDEDLGSTTRLKAPRSIAPSVDEDASMLDAHAPLFQPSQDDSDLFDKSPLLVPQSSSPPTAFDSSPPLKKRRISPVPHAKAKGTPFRSAYIGSFVIGNAWSTVKGRGYVRPGDEIRVERDEPQDFSTNAARSSTNGKGGHQKTKQKQTTLTSTFKPLTAKQVKQKSHTIVRLTNKGGFGEHPAVFTSCKLNVLQSSVVSHKTLLHGCPHF